MSLVMLPYFVAFLDRSRTVAGPGFNRWMVPPAAMCIHLSIGMAYGFSVFWLPLTRAIGIDHSIPCPETMPWYEKLFTTRHDWDKPLLGWLYTLFFVFLGSSAALFGKWLEHAGPRKAGLAAMVFWCGGMAIGAIGIYWHQLWLLWLGTGVLGGIGLGLGYISPVSTLLKWFPDRRGMATGMAIMGFGGGAMIGSPLADLLMRRFASPNSVGVWETLLAMAGIYAVFMTIGSMAYRVPPPDWQPNAVARNHDKIPKLFDASHVPVDVACKTVQFWLLWAVLCLNVTAGIGVIGMASPMIQEMFGGRLLGMNASIDQLTRDQMAQIGTVAAGFTGLLSLFNIAGRFFWASISDWIGRQNTYTIFFILGAALYCGAPMIGKSAGVGAFVSVFCVILTMYGGGFATIPAYLADLFGTRMVGAIHGRLLTAWSVAGILGPGLVNYINDAQLRSGVPKSDAYDLILRVMAGFMVAGFFLNLLVRPVSRSLYTTSEKDHAIDLAEINDGKHDCEPESGKPGSHVVAGALWAMAIIPLAWGMWMTMEQAARLWR
ncbi:MAG: OFA family MFS transporter [Planctomycetes bacterium]|nr:OFA family MFS transporter [Planctomycetota bacterium]